MRSFILLLMIFTGTVTEMAIASPPDTETTITLQQVAKFEISHAAEDARRAFATKDLHLYAVHGFALQVPGVPDENIRTLRGKYRLRVIEGTSDALKSTEDKALNERARQYAEHYNQEILRLAVK